MDYNLTRGKVIFWDTLTKSFEHFSPEEQDRLREIAKGFEDNVGVMPNEDLAIYAAKRLATAILEVGPIVSEGIIDTTSGKVLAKYNESAPGAGISKAHFVPESDVEKILGNYGKFAEAQEDEFEKQLRLNAEELEIDLIEDVENAELSVEGMRKKILVPSDFNSDTDKVPELKNTKVLGKVWFSDSGSIEKVECPWCNKSDAYQISHERFGCFVCDNEFDTPMEFGDNLS